MFKQYIQQGVNNQNMQITHKTSKKMNNPIKKCAKRFKYIFLKTYRLQWKDAQLIIREILIKTSNILTHIRMAIIEKDNK